MMTNKEIYSKAIKKWGIEAQLIKSMEEFAEVIKECSKYILETHKLGMATHETITNLIEEIADVEIMIEQIKLMEFGGKNISEEVANVKEDKVGNLMFMVRDK